MNAERLLAHYERIADAPDAIGRLRRFILDLAVRGKLVPQDAKDQPASELLKRIAKEKARRVAQGTLREQKPLPPIEVSEVEFELAQGWQWARMAEVIKLWNGFAFQSGDFQSSGVPVVRIGDLQDGAITLSGAAYVSEAVANTVGPEVWIPPDALLIAMSGATTGKTAFNKTGKPLLLNQRVGRMEVFSISVNFLRFFFETIVARNLSISFGTAIPNLSAQQINETVIPLPPFAEQHRIVAKVDELMALCDRLESARAEREATRDRLTASSLARLNAPDPGTFQADARFVLNALPALTTRPDQIKQLRQTILNLAVRGKLVPQDPKDEPAAELLKRIAKEKAQLRISGEKRKEVDLRDIASNDVPFQLPLGWSWVRMGLLGETNIGLTYSPGDVVELGVPVLRSSNIQNGKLDFEDLVRVRCEPKQGVMVKEGDLLICARNGSRALVGKVAIIENLVEPAAFGAFMAIFRSELNRYLYWFISSPLFRQVIDEVNTTTINQITQNNLRSTLVPLPPLAEQYRIVAKVDELMALCDQLEANLTDTDSTRRRLLDALLAEALEPAEVRETEAVG